MIGCKKWLFSDNTKGAKVIAALYSLVETARLSGVEPYEYMGIVYSRLPQAETVEAIEALLPWNVRTAEISESRARVGGGEG